MFGGEIMENFDINRLLKIFLNNKIYIAFILLLCFSIGYFYSYYYVTPMYQASATVVLVQNENTEQEVSADSSITQNDINLNKNLLSTYIKIATSDKVLERVISELNLDMSIDSLKELVSVEAVNSTQVFKITVSNVDKELAPAIANHLLEVFSEEVQSIYNMNNIYTMDQAEVSNTPYNINHIKDLTLFTMIGVVLSCILVFVIYMFDNTIKSEKDIEDYTNLSVLSSIPLYSTKNDETNTELIVDKEPKSPISECFKTFRTNIMFSIQNKKLNTVLVTSGFMGEGKSFVSSNLAVTFANSGKKVILIDTDMRKGRLHKIFNLSNENGLSTCLSKISIDGKLVNINNFIKESKIQNLHIMTSGIVPPNPSELLSSANMRALLNALNTQYDIVICDGTPCMLVSDSIILSKIVDTTVIVTANKTTKLDTLLKSQKSIEMVGGNIGGVVINKMEVNPKSYKNSYYYGEHGHYTVEKKEFVHDTILDMPLYITDLVNSAENEVKDEVTTSSVENNINNSNIAIDNLSNLIGENTKEILELKSTYKDTVRNIMDLIKNTDYSGSVLNELNNIKGDFSNALSKQNENLQNISNNYEGKLNELLLKQTEDLKDISSNYDNKFNELNNKIENVSFADDAKLINDSLNELKFNFNDALSKQTEELKDISDNYDNKFDELNNKIENVSFADDAKLINDSLNELNSKIDNANSFNDTDLILDNLNSLKDNFDDALSKQAEDLQNISANYEDKIDDVLSKQAEDLKNISANYENKLDNALSKQTEDLKNISNSNNEKFDDINSKIDNIQFTDTTDLISDKFEDVNNKIDNLNEKLENIKEADFSSFVFNKLNDFQDEYHNCVEAQNNDITLLNQKFDELNNNFANLKHNDNAEILNEIVKIYNKLEFINNKFEHLEERATNNEVLINNLSKELKENLAEPQPSLNIDNLNDNVIHIQDYLKDSAQPVAEIETEKENIEPVINEVKQDIEPEANEVKQDNEVEQNNDNNNVTIVDYKKEKENHQHKGFSLFRNKNKELIDEDDEPVEIVSQILLNSNEYVG
jgi:capsular exopolysaccharide synthesis family protein